MTRCPVRAGSGETRRCTCGMAGVPVGVGLGVPSVAVAVGEGPSVFVGTAVGVGVRAHAGSDTRAENASAKSAYRLRPTTFTRAPCGDGERGNLTPHLLVR